MFTMNFWKDAFERAIATFAQTFVALIGVELTGWTDLNWYHLAVTSLIAAGLSVLKSVAVVNLGAEHNASIVGYEYESEPDTVPDDDVADETPIEITEDEEPEDVLLNPPDPIDMGYEVEWPNDPDFVPTEIPEQELEEVLEEDNGTPDSR